MTNAAEALSDKQGFITVTTERAPHRHVSAVNGVNGLPEGEYVRLTVSDTGRGMNAETRAKIFDQFFTTKSAGRGLGLAAVRGIVRSHGGAINAASRLGAGATFEVLLPVYVCSERTAPGVLSAETAKQLQPVISLELS